jgi:alanine dehydrogenase
MGRQPWVGRPLFLAEEASMDIGVPREKRDFEKRVGLTPIGCQALVAEGHRVYVESSAGRGAGFSDEDYQQAGGEIVFSADEAFGRGELLLKVAPLLAEEHSLLQRGQTVLAFHHLATVPPRSMEALLQRHITAIAYETVQRPDGSLPVLVPMSQVAGRMAPQIASRYLESTFGGHGILLGGVPGVPPADVCILGAGVVGSYAARAFLGAGAHVTVLDLDPGRLETLERYAGSGVATMIAVDAELRRAVASVDVLVGAVLVPGGRAPILVTGDMVRSMRPSSVIIDFSIDQGGCVETSRPTTPRDPVFVAEDVVHYCVPNVPALVARTSTHALTNVTLPYVKEIAREGLRAALREDAALRAGVNIFEGRLVNPRVAASFGVEPGELGPML